MNTRTIVGMILSTGFHLSACTSSAQTITSSQEVQTSAELGETSAPQAETLQYRDGVAVNTANAAELEAFNAFKSAHQGLAPASREALRAWVASRNGKK